MAKGSRISRRELLGKAGAVAVAGAAAPLLGAMDLREYARSRHSPNDKLIIGMIGCASMGTTNMRNLMRFDDVEVAALCDVDSARIPGDLKLVEEKYGRRPEVYGDYRRMLERKDIDAVVISTPDHWHALNLIHACQAGKDAFCEKPLSYDIVEAKRMTEAARRHGRVVQTGNWQRSTKEFTDAVAYVRSGKLGRVTLCRAWISDGTRIGRGTPSEPPESLDYDFWIGPAAMVPYQKNKVHWNWRWVMNTGGGLTTDWGVHMMDIALLGMAPDQDLPMPTSVAAVGGLWAITDDDRDAPDSVEAIYGFENPDFAMHWRVGRDNPGRPGHGTEWVAADGKTVRVWRGGWSVLAPDGKELPKEESEPVGDHWRNWVDCVKTRETPRADIASIAKSTIVCHLANAALMCGETVRWDPERMDLVGDAGRDTAAYHREYRKPWRLE
jgi:predicted dehydrogenase